MKKIDEAFEIIHQYQKSALLFSINKMKWEDKLKWIKKEFPDLVQELLELDKFINYHTFNYDLWKEVGYCLENNKPLINSHADLNLEDYLIGLNQRNRLAWQNVKKAEYFDFVKDKVVLDFGCGGGFYSDIMSTYAKKVYCYDKKDVLEFIQSGKVNLRQDKCIFINDLKELPEPIEVAWISEVLHGKGMLEAHNILIYTNELLTNDGILVINELLQNTSLSKLFDIQMKIHTKEGILYNMSDINTFLNEITLIKMTDYHYTIGGRIV